MLSQVKDFALESYAHQDVPFEMIVDALQPERDLSHSPLFQVMFALQSSQMTSQTLPSSGLMLSPVEAHSGTSKFDLTLFMVEEEFVDPSGSKYNISGAMEYNTDLFDRPTIERMMEHFREVLESIVQDSDQPVTALNMLQDEEFNQMIVEWNRTEEVIDQDLCAHQMFENQNLLLPR